MSACKHRRITTYVTIETREPAGLWACADCHVKFVPLTQLIEEVDAEREACAKACERVAFYDRMTPLDCAQVIRDRGAP